jgi:hypothetical protein
MSQDSAGSPINLLGCVLPLTMLALGVAQVVGAFVGFQYLVGTGWTIAIFAAAVIFRLFPFLFPIGAFIGALNVWEWPWYGALAFAAPGLALTLLLMPGLLASAWSTQDRAS